MPARKARILITSGPTQEPLDPVRYVSNFSTGLMGLELARAAARRGYEVTLISGPTNARPPKGIRSISIRTTAQLRREINKHWGACDFLIMAAAVCDFRPKRVSVHKLKKTKRFSLELEQTPDILTELGRKKGRRILVGFALETENLLKNAMEKLKKKNLDFIVASQIDKGGSPFGNRRLAPILIFKDKRIKKFPWTSKKILAQRVIRELENLVGQGR
jgi:phosphopantothenoylcysteine decarboxylase/phosphopantothenate--cysteine ligase